MLYRENVPKLIAPSFKQRQFVHKYIATGNKAKAYREVYGDRGIYNSRNGKAVLEHPMTQQYYKQLLNNAGATPEKVGKVLATIMERSVSEEALKMTTPAHGLKAAEMTARILDMNPAEKKQTDIRKVNLNLESKSITELTEMMTKLTEDVHRFKKLVTETENVKVVS